MPQLKLLIAGNPHSGQKEVVEKLTGSALEGHDSLAGLVLDHKFVTRYFTLDCGIWTDEFGDSSEWAAEFCSPEAREVVDAIALFIFTFDSKDPEIAGLDRFVEVLSTAGTSLAVPRAGVDPSTETFKELSEMGFDIVPFEEIEPVVHTTLFEAINEGAESDDFEPGDVGPPREIEEILEELQRARTSTTMTKEEKMALAERLADELL